MLFKICMLAVIVIASVALGNVIVSGAGDRIRTLVQLVNCVKAMKNGMIYQGMTLFEALAYGDKVGLSGFLLECAQILKKNPELSGKQIVKQAMEKENRQVSHLKGQEREAFLELMDRLSGAVVREQIEEATGVFFREMNSLIRELSEEQAKKSKLIKTMCLLSGLAVAIILV